MFKSPFFKEYDTNQKKERHNSKEKKLYNPSWVANVSKIHI